MNELNDSSMHEINNENLPLIQKKRKFFPFQYKKSKTLSNRLSYRLDSERINNDFDQQDIELPKLKNSKKLLVMSLTSINSNSSDLDESELDKINESNSKIYNEEEKKINDIERSESIERLRKQEWCCCFFVFMSLLMALEYQEITSNPTSLSTSNNNLYNTSIDFVLIISSLCSLCFSKFFYFIISINIY